MPLHSNHGRTLGVAGESRRLGGQQNPSAASSRDNSQQRGGPGHEVTAQHGQANTVNRRIGRDELEDLKEPVRNTLQPKSNALTMKRQSSQSTEDEKENDELHHRKVKQEPGGNFMNMQRSQYQQQGDDDTSVTFGSHGWDQEQDYDEQKTAIFNPNPTLFDLLNNPDLRPEAQAGPRMKTHASKPQSILLQGGRQPVSYRDVDESRIGDDDEIQYEDARRLANNTPSRSRSLLVSKTLINQNKAATVKKVNFQENRSSSPIEQDGQHTSSSGQPQQEVVPHSSLARHAAQREVLKQHVPSELPLPVLVNNNVAAKVSASHEIMQEPQHELPQPLPAPFGTKRHHEEIDYDMPELKKKSYADLDGIPFLEDPRAPPGPAQVDGGGNLMTTLAARLTNLNKIAATDQQNLFRTLTDEENEQTGQWFVEKFQADLKKLMDKRLEKRKIALKFELETRKRQMTVQVKIADCETELDELKSGGGKLIEGRSVAKIGGTPRKAVSHA